MLPRHRPYLTTPTKISSCTTTANIKYPREHAGQGLRNFKRTLLDGGCGTRDLGPSANFTGRHRCFALLKNVIRPSGRSQLCRPNSISPSFPFSLLRFLLKQAGEK